MVIYDNQKCIPRLYLSYYDVSYLTNKYNIKFLSYILSSQQLDIFKRVNEFPINKINREQLYALVCLPIKNEKKSQLLDIVRAEVNCGYMMTREQVNNFLLNGLENKLTMNEENIHFIEYIQELNQEIMFCQKEIDHILQEFQRLNLVAKMYQEQIRYLQNQLAICGFDEEINDSNLLASEEDSYKLNKRSI